MKGLYPKYTVTNNETGEEVRGAFILKPERDPHARVALVSYADSIATANPPLANDLANWMKELNERPTNFAFSISIDPSHEDEIREAAYVDAHLTVAVISGEIDDETLDSLEIMCKNIEADLEAKGVWFGWKIRNIVGKTLRSSDGYHRNAKGAEIQDVN